MSRTKLTLARLESLLLPDDDILQSQFPQVLAELETQHSRLTELQALFAAASEEDFADTEDTGVLPADQVKALKAELKEAKGLMKLAKRDRNFGDWTSHQQEAMYLDKQLARHKTLEDEARTLKVLIKSTEARKNELVEQARLKISNEEAKMHEWRSTRLGELADTSSKTRPPARPPHRQRPRQGR